jgi:hypothetical protein
LRVIPILVGDTRLPSADQLPDDIEELARRQYFRVYPRSAHRDLRLLGDELATLMRPTMRVTAPSARFGAPRHIRDTGPATLARPPMIITTLRELAGFGPPKPASRGEPR